MRQTTANQFRANLISCCVQALVEDHESLRVSRKDSDFVVVSADDWQR